MKTLVETKKLLKLFNNANGYIVPKKCTIPIVERTLIKVSEKSITVLSTDLENHLQQTMVVDSSDFVKTDGFAVDGKTLSGLLSKITTETVMIEYQASSLKISSGDNNYQLPFLSGKDFPEFALLDKSKEASFEINAAVFKNYLSKALPFVGADKNRPIMMAIHMVIKDKIVRIEATDSVKILQANDTIETDLVADINIPSSFAVVFNKIYENETVIIRTDEKRIDAVGENFEFSCRLIEGRYPNTAPLFETVRAKKATFTKTAMLPAIERLMLFANQTSTALRFIVKKEAIYIEAADVEMQLSGAEKINAHYTEQEEFRVGLAGKHFDTVLNAFRSDDLTMSIDHDKSPILFEDNLKAVHVLLMPIAI